MSLIAPIFLAITSSSVVAEKEPTDSTTNPYQVSHQ
jgi:hypothetical protein